MFLIILFTMARLKGLNDVRAGRAYIA